MAFLQPLNLFDDLTPHGYCLLWDPVLIWSHLLSDLAIAGAYLSIPAALIIVARRRPDLNPVGVFYFFAAFIILCAITHIFGLLTLWYPLYTMQAVAKIMTAMVSVTTSVLVWRMLDAVLAAPTHFALQQVTEKNATLEAHVEARTVELRRANERLEVVATEALEAERVKTEFLGRMSHELRTPLNAVIGFTELLSMQLAGPINATQRDYLKSVQTASTQLLEQINDILDLERLVQHGPNFDPEEVALDTTLAEVCRMLSSLTEKMNVEISTDIEPASRLYTDGRALRLVLTNLISNAVKYSRKGGSVEVTVSSLARGVEIIVTDHGFGIPEEKLADVFQPFVRGHERDLPSVGGTGLGLALVKQLVDALGGDIQMSSELGRGTTVHLMLPEMARGRASMVG